MTTHYLLSLPPAMAAHADLFGLTAPDWLAASDPPGGSVGSGGGTAHLLAEAWRVSGSGRTFAEWLRDGRKMVIHGGGQSRRLPAYAALGKPFLPLPILRGEVGQRLDQTLLDFQRPVFDSLLAAAPPSYVVGVASGDVLLRFAPPDTLPEADVLALGMPASPEMAQSFGVFFFRRESPQTLAFFLQKPSADRIRRLADDHLFLVDTGLWLLSERATLALMAQCGWDIAAQAFRGGRIAPYDFYARFGPALGAAPSEPDVALRGLSAAAVMGAESEFYHLGTSRQMIESASRLQNQARSGAGWPEMRRNPDQFVLSAVFDPPVRQAANHTLWVDNGVIPASWQIAHDHVLTGVPHNDWALTLEPGVCLDFVPVGETDYCVRAYGLDDSFRGPIGDAATLWLGQPAPLWAERRGLAWESAGIPPASDLYDAPLFPILPLSQISGPFMEWLFASEPSPDPGHAALWLSAPRLSAAQINVRANVPRLVRQRDENLRRILPLMHGRSARSAFFGLDLAATARLMAASQIPLPPSLPDSEAAPALTRMQDSMLRATVLRPSHTDEAARHEDAAFRWLRESLLEGQPLRVRPVRDVLDDQILWGRSPLRFDLAGGWTDTPPYCLQHGGRVLNLAVNLNGQPPVQVFARPTDRPELVLRSIDLGLERRLTTYEELDTFAQPASDFALAKAALALAGFLPRFHAGGGFPTLAAQLDAQGGGLELSLLAAAPQGSGLGTSSLLAATILGVLSEFCGLRWDRQALVTRTLLLEQLVTTGGGWQDQAGGLYPGVKLIETAPGPAQTVSVRWAPDRLFAPSEAGGRMLLYYTGLTRLAKTLLQDIVRGMFLGDARVLSCLRDIGDNAGLAYDALQRGSYDDVCASVARSWALNQALDAGTNPPAVQTIFDRVGDWLLAGKLTGAGGGGYLLLLAKDEAAAGRIREELTARPPNARARFVAFGLSETGMQVTRS